MRMTCSLAALSVIAGLVLGHAQTASSTPPAQAASADASSGSPFDSAALPDVLTLRDGTILRGHVYEVHPGQFVNIALLNGDRRTIAAVDLAGATGPAFSAAPWAVAQSVSPSSPLDPYAFTLPGPGRVPLVVTSEGAQQSVFFVYGRAMVGSGRSRGVVLLTTPMCSTPCRLFVLPGEFPIVTRGRGLRETYTLIDVPADGVSVQMHAPSLSAWTGVVVLAGFGAAAFFASIPLWLIGGIEVGSRSYAAGATNLLIGAGATTAGMIGFLAAAIALGVTHPAGVAHRGPVGAELAMFGVTPTDGGASVTVGLRF